MKRTFVFELTVLIKRAGILEINPRHVPGRGRKGRNESHSKSRSMHLELLGDPNLKSLAEAEACDGGVHGFKIRGAISLAARFSLQITLTTRLTFGDENAMTRIAPALNSFRVYSFRASRACIAKTSKQNDPQHTSRFLLSIIASGIIPRFVTINHAVDDFDPKRDHFDT